MKGGARVAQKIQLWFGRACLIFASTCQQFDNFTLAGGGIIQPNVGAFVTKRPIAMEWGYRKRVCAWQPNASQD